MGDVGTGAFFLCIKEYWRLSSPLYERGAMMANENLIPISSENPDPQKIRASDDDITASQEQQIQPASLPKSLVEWLANINRRYLALNQEKTNDTS